MVVPEVPELYAKKSSPENRCAASCVGRLAYVSDRQSAKAVKIPFASFSDPSLSTDALHGSTVVAKSYCATSTTRMPGENGACSKTALTTFTTWMPSSCIASRVGYMFTRARSLTTISST